MKNKSFAVKIIFIVFFCVLISLLISFCSVSQMPIQVLIPAEISIKKEIKHIGIVNRSIPSKKRKIANILEGFVSGESIMADRIAAEHCLQGLAEKLNNSPRFSAVIIHGEKLRGTGTRVFPAQLQWSRVREICTKHRVDALIALETFDSDIDYKTSKRMRKKKEKDKETGEKITVKVPRYHIHLYIDVNSGWKIYDPNSEAVIDANVYTDRKSWRVDAKSKMEARRKLPDKRDAINIAGYNSGVRYGLRISPTWIDVYRKYYVKGSPEFKEAYRYIRADDWEKAVSIWKGVLENSEKKIAGRAAYNIAVAEEVLGDLEEAYNWAKKSYTEYGNKSALHYMRILRTRIEDRNRLREQL